MTKTFENDELRRVAPGFRALLIGGASALAIALTPAVAQDAPDTVDTVDEADDDDDDDKVVVTGSRVRRDTFSSISPLQVITTQDSLDVGLIDPTAILQQSEAAAGQQIDQTFQGFVLDNGPGSETLNLRGLGAGRTLLLINGRRMAPAGVEGAPTQPSINLLPGSLIDRYDLLLDGASSVYGSDAVAGVGNVILRKDFEGLELFASGDYAVAGAGHDFTLSGAWGKNTDRGFFGIGAEYDYTDEVTFADRSFLAGCQTHYEETETGEIRTVDISTNFNTLQNTQGLIGARQSPCISGAGGFSDRIFDRESLAFGSAYYTPGTGNILPDFSDTGLFSVPIDANQDGIADIYFPDFSPGSRDLEQSLYPEQKKFSVMAYGEYTFEGDMNITPYFEALFVDLRVEANSGQGTLFPDVPATNPYNVCNPNAITGRGVDCFAAEDALLASDHYLAAFQSYYDGGGGSANCFGFSGPACTPGLFGLFNNAPPGTPASVSAQVNVRGDRNLTDVVLQQTRGVAGFRADLPFLNAGPLQDWAFDASVTYSYAEGDSTRPGVRDDRLALALGWDPTTDLNMDGIVDGGTNNTGALLELPGGPCDAANVSNPDLLEADAAAGCVPVDMFAPSLYGGVGGDFATQAERDYLFDNRDVNTIYEQTIFSAFLTGQVFELPAGAVSAVAGVEYRVDSIETNPDRVASEGLFFGFFSDQGVNGEKWTREAFFELDVPLIAGKPLIRQLDLNASARWTEDEFYGSAWTYAVKGGWRPFDSLLLKASVGTSFRAPNLRENFILGTSGFSTVIDPCAVPASAIALQGDGSFGYAMNPTSNEDPRLDTPEIFDNCIREGRDPFSVGINTASGQGGQAAGVEVTTGGTTDIQEETSDSYTAGVSFEQPWFESFDLTLGASYYDIEVEDSIISPSSQFIVNDCYLRTDGSRSPFCDRLTYGGTFGEISFVEASFLNQDKETVAGIDYNVRFSKELTAFDQPMDFGIGLRANQLKERTQIFINSDLTETVDQDAGEFGFPEWTGTATFTLDVSDYRFTWQTRMVGEVEAYANSDDGKEVDLPFNGNGSTCLGVANGDVNCRDVSYAEDWYEHAASIRYVGDTWTVRAGVNNVFDKKPPLVDGAQVFQISNTPIGNGYDLDGRQFFLTVQKDFN